MEVKEIQKEVLELVKIFKTVCDENNIEYTLAAGSVLGAVRHKGFIPWDPDMDVLVRVDQFELLRSKLLEKIKSQNNIKLYMWDKEKNYPEVVDRLCLTNVPHEQLHLDIFPLIGAPDGKVKRYIFSNLCYYTYKILRCKHCNTEYSKPNHVKTIKFIKVFMKLIPDKVILKWYKFLEKKYDIEKSNYCYLLASGYGYNEALKKEVYLETIESDFEDIKLAIPKAYKFYLTQIYGNDYMIPKKDGYKKIN